jgi:hypothetical protein
VELTTAGQIVWEWRGWEHLAPVEDGIPFPQDGRGMWMNGNLLLFDNGAIRADDGTPYSWVIEVDRATKEIVWEYHENP